MTAVEPTRLPEGAPAAPASTAAPPPAAAPGATPAGAPSEAESRQVAEDARQKEWKQPSFLRELYLGRFRFDLIHPFPEVEERAEFKSFYDRFATFLRERVDTVEIDATGEYPDQVIQGLRELGAFGMKIPKEYGGLGFTQTEYDKVMRLLGSVDGSVGALLSAHQSIGVPQPVKIFGTKEQKERFLPRCAKGAISAFALTEPDVGSDPARLATTCELSPDGTHYVIDGEKLWCTNGTIAELFVVMARDPKTKKISAFVVEAASEGVEVKHRCRFMGLKALANAVVAFKQVKVPVGNRIGKEGEGLKIALVTLNTGRLALPASCSGAAKLCLEICRRWAGERSQWGAPIGRHQAIAHKLADMAATTFAMEAMSDLASRLADRGGYDIRLEAAAAKEWCSVEAWRVIDDTRQIRGGRGYETERSLAARGETPIPFERVMRDARINRIFEGSSEVMHLFIAREAVDKHLEVAGALIDPKRSLGERLARLPKIAAFYAGWYPSLWFGWGRWPRFSEHGALARHLRFCERTTRKLARQVFHGMLVHQAKLERKQGFLFRLVDIGNEVFSVAAACSRALHMQASGHPAAREALALADLHARNAARRVDGLFRALWWTDDDRKDRVAKAILAGEHAFVERGTLGLPAPAQGVVEPKAGVG